MGGEALAEPSPTLHARMLRRHCPADMHLPRLPPQRLSSPSRAPQPWTPPPGRCCLRTTASSTCAPATTPPSPAATPHCAARSRCAQGRLRTRPLMAGRLAQPCWDYRGPCRRLAVRTELCASSGCLRRKGAWRRCRRCTPHPLGRLIISVLFAVRCTACTAGVCAVRRDQPGQALQPLLPRGGGLDQAHPAGGEDWALWNS